MRNGPLQIHPRRNAEGWIRVKKSYPCPICEKPDWCLSSSDGSAVICARIASEKRRGDAGWLHRLRDDNILTKRTQRARPTFASAPRPESIDFKLLSDEFESKVVEGELHKLADALGVTAESLRRLGIGWSASHSAWAFPLTDTWGNVRGIRLRSWAGKKFSVRGGKEGLFLPREFPADLSGKSLFISEGPTDSAALLDLGFLAIGRPSCNGGATLIWYMVQGHRPGSVILVADGDEPGKRGAWLLGQLIFPLVPSVKIVIPPSAFKDLRDWKRAGATALEIQKVVDSTPALKPIFQVRRS